MRIGHGYDVHKFAPDRPLILGGCQVPHDMGLLGHSDADVLTHAIMDALLGAAALGDIGVHFPDTDPNFKGADSLKLLVEVAKKISRAGFSILNIDSTIIAQTPKLSSFLPKMKQTLAQTCCISPAQINIKATTEEGLGFTGANLGIAAHAVCFLG